MIDCNALHVLKESFTRQDDNARAANIINALKSQGSDAVRTTLNGISEFDSFLHFHLPLALLNFFEDKLSKLSNSDDEKAKAKAEYVCGVPFFCCEEKPKPKTKRKTTLRMSGKASGVHRTCTRIENCIKYKVHFSHFDVIDALDEEFQSGGCGGESESESESENGKGKGKGNDKPLQTTTCETATGTETGTRVPVLKIDRDDKEIARNLAKSLHTSFTRLHPRKNEDSQKEAILDSFQPILQLFGYNYEIKERPDLHFQFIRDHNETSTSDSTSTIGIKEEDDNEVILCGEAKTVANLPQKEIIAELSAHLCRYGFGTAIARQNYYDESMNQKAEVLRNLLEITHDKLPQKIDGNGNIIMSEMVKEILQWDSQNQIDDTITSPSTSTSSSSDILTKMTASAKKVNEELQDGNISSKDAINLWGATMQACEASLTKRMRYTVVMSARMMWFIKLDAIANADAIAGGNADAKCVECTVLISAGILIGSNDFTQTLIRFIMLADGDVLDDSIMKNWNSDFMDLRGKGNNKKEDKSSNKRDRTSSSKNDSTESNGGHEGSGSPNIKRRNKTDSSNVHNLPLMTSKSISRPSNIFRAVSKDDSSSSSPIKTVESPPHKQIIQSADDHCFTNKVISPGPAASDMGNTNTNGNVKSKSIDHTSTSSSNSKRMTDEEQMMWQRAFTGLGNANMKYLDQDQYGVIVPYLCQLEGAELESLGDGRCGTVKKIRWNGSVAAMKEYVFQHEDDERVPSDVYEHEIKVFYRLEALWGRYVPRLLFRNPWSCRPSIGMEVGQPMDSDIDKWEEEDKVKMKETIAEIKNKGFRQNDLRGSNFVRLDSGHIAMIDFEDVVEISSSACAE